MKKLLCLILSASVVFASICGFAEEENEQNDLTPDTQAQEFGFCDFDGRGSIVGGTNVYYDGDEHKNVGEIPAYGAAGLNFTKKVTSGKVVTSFDIMFKNTVQLYLRTYTEINRGGTYYHNFYANSSGKMVVPIEGQDRSWSLGKYKKYDFNTWYGMDIWFDFDTRTVKIYLDGEFFGQTVMVDGMTEMASFGLLPTTDGVVIDNIGAIYIPTNGAADMSKYPYIHYHDPEYDNAVQPWIETGELGDAYFGENIDFTLNLVNNQDTAAEGTAKVKYINSDGVSTTAEKEFKLDGYGSQLLDFNITDDCYGYATLEAAVTDNSGNILGVSSKDISVVAKGRMNYKIGFADHVSGDCRGYLQFEFLKKIGAGSYRDGLEPYGVYEDGKAIDYDDGKVRDQTGKALKRFIKIAEENDDIHYLFVLGMRGIESTGYVGMIPRGQNELNHYLEYVKVVLDLTKNIKHLDFEMGNEFNYQIKNAPDQYNSKQYYELCKAAYSVIKSIRPDARVFGCSSGSTDNTETYLNELMEYGTGEYMDGFTIHPYDVFHGPENIDTRERTDGLHKLFADAGYGDKPIIYSEYGWTTTTYTGVDADEKARWVPQAAILYTDHAESNDFYNLLKDEGNSDFETNFGFVEHFSSEVPYKPTKSLMTLSNYNRLMAGTGNLEEYKFANGDAAVCAVKDESGKRSIMAWMQEDKPDSNVAINVGASEVAVYDLYGNGTTVKTENGVLNVALTQDPIYIIGDIKEVSEASPSMYVNERAFEVVENDTAFLTGKLPDASYVPELVCPDNIKPDSVDIKPDGTFSIKLNIGGSGQKSEKIRIMIKKDNEVIYYTYADVSYTEPIEVVPSIIYYRDSYWQLKLKIVNRANSANANGKVVLTEPSEFKIPAKQAEFKNILPGASKYVYINIPPQYTKQKLDVKGYVETENGAKIDFSETSYFVGLMYLSKEPVIDGKISEGEYNINAPVKLNTKDYTINRLADYPGFDETRGNIYLNYDEHNLYLAAKVYDSVEGATGDSTKVWQNDSIQLALAEVADVNAARTEYCIGKDNTGKPTITRYAFIGTKTVAGGGAGDEVKMGDDIKLEIGREGMYTIYEFRIPWSEVFGEERPVLDRRNLLFSALINDNDGLGRTGYVEFCPGIGTQKNPALFSKIQAMK